MTVAMVSAALNVGGGDATTQVRHVAQRRQRAALTWWRSGWFLITRRDFSKDNGPAIKRIEFRPCNLTTFVKQW